jgi:hypothetical protein
MQTLKKCTDIIPGGKQQSLHVVDNEKYFGYLRASSEGQCLFLDMQVLKCKHSITIPV